MKRNFLGAMIALAASAILFSCEEPQQKPDPQVLATPQVSAQVDGNTVTVSWEAVENAVSYSYAIDGGSSTTTDQTSVTVSDLTFGEHTVSVTAFPAEGSEDWSASEAGTATFTIEDNRVKLATPEVSANTDDTGVTTVSWTAVEGAASYTYTIDGGTPSTVTETSVVYQPNQLAAGEHVASVIAVPEEGSAEYIESDAGEVTFTTEQVTVEPSPDLQEWLGEWTLTSTGTVVYANVDGYLESSYEPESPMTVNLSIEPSTDENIVFVYGLVPIDGVPVLASIFTDNESGAKYLGLLTDEYPIAQDSDGNNMVSIPVSLADDNSIVFVTGCQYSFLFDSSLKGIPYESTLSDNRAFKAVAVDVVSIVGQQIYFYYSEYPVNLPAGDLTLARGASGSSVTKTNGAQSYSRTISGVQAVSAR